MSSRVRSVKGAVVALWLLAGSGDALADHERARQLFTEGESAFGTGRFLDAAHLFEEAYHLSLQPQLLWNIAQSYRRQYEIDGDLQNLRRARVVFQNYDEVAPSESERLEARAAQIETERQIEVAEKRAQAVSVRSNVARPMVVEKPRTFRKAGFALWGVGGAIGLAGMGFGLAAHNEANTVQGSGTPSMPVPFGPLASHAERGRNFEIVSFTFYGVAAAAVVAGTILVLIHQRGTARYSPVSRSSSRGALF